MNPYDPVDPQKKVVKILRKKIVEPSSNVGFEPTSQIAVSRVDRQNPLFRGAVEQVLDNRNLKPERQPEEYLAPGNHSYMNGDSLTGFWPIRAIVLNLFLLGGPLQS